MARMKTPTKFVKPLTTEQREQLSAIMKSAAPQRTRMRAHAVLLSERRYSLDQIADIYQVDRDRVSQWLEWWEAEQVEGLDDEPRSGTGHNLTKAAERPVEDVEGWTVRYLLVTPHVEVRDGQTSPTPTSPS